MSIGLRNLALLFGVLIVHQRAAADDGPRDFDVRRAAAAGVRVLDGKYVRLLTDLPASPAVDELPKVFDAAVPLWADYFHVDRGGLTVKRWLACLIVDRDRFAALGLMPADNPDFVNGYARDWEFWLMNQPSDYYRRHLLLHEGTHAFMQTQLHGCGAPWYMEGTAELLGTHQWRDGRLKLGVMPPDRESVPMWGRIKLVREAGAEGKSWSLDRVLEVDNRHELPTESYAWVWALSALLDGHPKYQARFRELQNDLRDPEFTERFRNLFADDGGDLALQWQAYVATLDYGYDVPRMAIEMRDATPVGEGTQRVTIDADRGWQSTGWLLKAGERYQITASGRYQIARDADGEAWPCEPGGVTIEYHDGRPLGALLGALHPATQDADASFAHPALLGLEATLQPTADAVLYVRVNDSPAKLGDNEGEVSVKIEAKPR